MAQHNTNPSVPEGTGTPVKAIRGGSGKDGDRGRQREGGTHGRENYWG